MRTLVLCSNSILGISVIRCLGAAGHSVCALGTRAFPFYRTSRYCAEYAALGAEGLRGSPEQIISLINQKITRHGIEVIVAADLPAALLAGELGERLHAPLFPQTEPAVLRRLHDKWTFALFLAETNLPHPRTALVEKADQIGRLEIDAPWIVKPRAGEGGVGVSRVDSGEQLEKIMCGKGEALLVQEFISGSDIDLSFLANHGRLVAWTIQTGEPTSMRRVFQSHPRVLEIGRALAAACEYHGVAHVDMRIDERDGTVRILEINPRFWNTLCHSMCMGVNFPDLGIRMMKGESSGETFKEPEGICDSFEMTAGRIIHSMFSARAPRALGGHADRLWRLTGTDPLPDLCRWARRVFPMRAAPGAGALRRNLRAAVWGL